MPDDRLATPPPSGPVFGVRLPRASDPQLRRLRALHQPGVHGHRVWASTWLLLDYLEQHPPAPGSRVLDAGCGWGIISVGLARRHGAHVIAADVDSQVFPYVELHARLNDVQVGTLQAGFDTIPGAVLRATDLLCGADICFRADLMHQLHGLIARAVQAGVRHILIADPGRPHFRQLGARCVQHLGGRELPWRVREPRLHWQGAAPRISGFVLAVERQAVPTAGPGTAGRPSSAALPTARENTGFRI